MFASKSSNMKLFQAFDSMDKDTALFAIACGFTGLAMFILGAIKSKFSQQSWFMSGLTVLMNGGAAAGAGGASSAVPPQARVNQNLRFPELS